MLSLYFVRFNSIPRPISTASTLVPQSIWTASGPCSFVSNGRNTPASLQWFRRLSAGSPPSFRTFCTSPSSTDILQVTNHCKYAESLSWDRWGSLGNSREFTTLSGPFLNECSLQKTWERKSQNFNCKLICCNDVN